MPEFEVTIELSIDAIVEHGWDDEDRLYFIKSLEEDAQDWEFTKQVVEHYKGVEKEYYRENNETPPLPHIDNMDELAAQLVKGDQDFSYEAITSFFEKINELVDDDSFTTMVYERFKKLKMDIAEAAKEKASPSLGSSTPDGS